MKIVIACDSFKGSLPAEAVCATLAATLRASCPGVQVVALPLADGGEGTVAAVLDTLAGQWVQMDVMGPLPHLTVEAGFGWCTCPPRALIEMAVASGLELLRSDQRDPMRTTTYGTGQLLKAAFLHEAPVMLAVGGSATVDGGVGAAMALGWRFLDTNGREIGFGGGALQRLVKIAPPAQRRYPPVTVLADVDHPLCGPGGAARVFGPQKGAQAEDVIDLERGLEQLARVIRTDLGIEVSALPGGGAAGGLAAGATAFLGAEIRPGGPWVREAVGLKDELADTDWVITGEGCFDATSLRGKVVSGVLEDARDTGTRVAVIAGSVKLNEADWRAAGVSAVLPLCDGGVPESYAIEHARELLADRAASFAETRLVSPG